MSTTSATPTQPLTPADLRQFIAQNAIDAHLIDALADTPTVPAAAAALGVESDQIIKTLLFAIELPDPQAPQPVVVICNGERRVDKKLLADHFGVSKKRITLAPAAVVLDLLGYPAGGVPPFGHRTRQPVLLDAAIGDVQARFDGVVYGGGGDDRTMMKLTVDELVRITNPVVVALSSA